MSLRSSADLRCLCTTEEARAKKIRILWDVLRRWCQQRRIKCLFGKVLQLQEREHTHLHEADRGRGWSPEPLCQHQLVREERRPPRPAELAKEPENSKVGWRLVSMLLGGMVCLWELRRGKEQGSFSHFCLLVDICIPVDVGNSKLRILAIQKIHKMLPSTMNGRPLFLNYNFGGIYSAEIVYCSLLRTPFQYLLCYKSMA